MRLKERFEKFLFFTLRLLGILPPLFGIYKKKSVDGAHLASKFHTSSSALRYHYQTHCLGPGPLLLLKKERRLIGELSRRSSSPLPPWHRAAGGMASATHSGRAWQGLTGQAHPTASTGSRGGLEAAAAPMATVRETGAATGLPWCRHLQPGPMGTVWRDQQGSALTGAAPASWEAATYTRNGFSPLYIF